MSAPKRKTLRAERDTLIGYDDALVLFKAAGLCTCARTCRDHIKAHPELCPEASGNADYHFKRFRLGDVEKLVEHLRQKYPARTVYATVTDTAVSRLAAITKGTR